MPVTPLRKQYLRIKQRYPEAIVFFRLGDFYETFDDDARITSRELEIVLTSREMGKGIKVPLAGIPYHALENYLAKLISRGYKVAICEQLDRAGQRAGGAGCHKGGNARHGHRAGPAGGEEQQLPGERGHAQGAGRHCLCRYHHRRVRRDADSRGAGRRRDRQAESGRGDRRQVGRLQRRRLRAISRKLDDYYFELDTASRCLLEHFQVASLEGYGCAGLPPAVSAAGAIIGYLRENQKAALGLLTSFPPTPCSPS